MEDKWRCQAITEVQRVQTISKPRTIACLHQHLHLLHACCEKKGLKRNHQTMFHKRCELQLLCSFEQDVIKDQLIESLATALPHPTLAWSSLMLASIVARASPRTSCTPCHATPAAIAAVNDTSRTHGRGEQQRSPYTTRRGRQPRMLKTASSRFLSDRMTG